jgi:hypothetical protein
MSPLCILNCFGNQPDKQNHREMRHEIILRRSLGGLLFCGLKKSDLTWTPRALAPSQVDPETAADNYLLAQPDDLNMFSVAGWWVFDWRGVLKDV